MSFGDIGKKFTEQRSQQSGKQSDDSALFTYSHDTQPKRKDTGQSQWNLKSGFGGIESRVDNFGKHLCVAKENESHQRYYEGYQKKGYPNVVQNHIASFISNNSDKISQFIRFWIRKDSILLFLFPIFVWTR